MCVTKKFPCLGLCSKDVVVRARETMIMETPHPQSPPNHSTKSKRDSWDFFVKQALNMFGNIHLGTGKWAQQFYVKILYF